MLYPDNETNVCPCLFITANERLQTLTIWGGVWGCSKFAQIIGSELINLYVNSL